MAHPVTPRDAADTDHLAGAQDPLPGDWGLAKGMGYADHVASRLPLAGATGPPVSALALK